MSLTQAGLRSAHACITSRPPERGLVASSILSPGFSLKESFSVFESIGGSHFASRCLYLWTSREESWWTSRLLTTFHQQRSLFAD